MAYLQQHSPDTAQADMLRYFLGQCTPVYTSQDFGIAIAVYRVTEDMRQRFPTLAENTVTFYLDTGVGQSL